MTKTPQTDAEKIAEGVTGIARKVGNAIRRGAYNAASQIERAADDPTTPLGKAVETAKGLDKKVQERGGYGAVVKGASRDVFDFTRENVVEPVTGLYKKIQTGFFDEKGNFNNDKARESLTDMSQAVRSYGEKAVDTLTSMAREGVKAVKSDYRDMIPTEEERKTKYAGIGKDYRGILFREHFESCLSFHESARVGLPGGLRARGAILADIRSTASGSLNDLVKHYESTNQSEKAETARKYLSTKPKSR